MIYLYIVGVCDMKYIRKILLLSLFAFLVMLPSKAFALTRVSNLTELQSALEGDDDEIVVTQAIDITSDTVLDGNEKVIRAEVTGLNMQGLINENSSKYNIFTISSPNITFKIKDAFIYGGGQSIIYTKQSGVNINAEYVAFSLAGSLDSVTYDLNITTNDKVTLNKCSIGYNVADYDSVMYIPRGSSVLMNDVDICYNRSFGTTNTGGATIENRGNLYINNSTIANNYGTNLGGAIYNIEGKLYIMNTTIAGNVITGDTLDGGGIYFDGGGIDGAKAYIVNSIVNDNYSLDNNIFSYSDISSNFPSENDILSLQSSNVGKYEKDPQSNYDYFTSTNTTTGLNQQNFYYRDSSLVSATGDLSTITYKRPVIEVTSSMVYINGNTSVATGGIYTFFDYDDSLNVKMSYGATDVAGDSTALGGLSKATTLVSQYGNGQSRVAGVMGASGTTEYTLFTLNSVKSDNGYLIGSTLFGDGFDNTTNCVLLAVPDSGYHVKTIEKYVDGEWVTLTTNSFYQITISSDNLVRAVFEKDAVDNGDSGSGLSGSDDSGTEETTENPNTGDNIVIYGSLLVISLLVLGVCFKLKEN